MENQPSAQEKQKTFEATNKDATPEDRERSAKALKKLKPAGLTARPRRQGFNNSKCAPAKACGGTDGNYKKSGALVSICVKPSGQPALDRPQEAPK